MRTYYLAVDIGASSGRHMLAWVEDGNIRLEEIYRFENGMVKKDGHLCWDPERLLEEIVHGLILCRETDRIPVSMGIDTWAVDFVLLDREGNVLGDAVGYRDRRTDGADRKVYEHIGPEELYARTGIQKQSFNTIYQLMAVKEQTPEQMEQADSLLMLPDYFTYRLTGAKRTEYTNATTTQLVRPDTKDWDWELIERLGYKASLFQPIVPAGTPAGRLTQKMRRTVGFDLDVIHVASHDTASAVLAVPAQQEKFLYISSGTWSLIGTALEQADCSRAAREANLTNEGGYAYRFRFLKNIMGLWMLQSVRHELGDRYSFAQLCRMAESCGDIRSRVDVNDSAFLAPERMTEAIQTYCRTTGQEQPKTPGELAAVIYHSLAASYAEAAEEIEAITGEHYPVLHIVGGGANADYLNQLTADASGKTVYSGPSEATALGNAAVQLIEAGVYKSPEEVRRAIYRSFPVRCFRPSEAGSGEAF